jgi:hypothetical protein
MLCDVDRFTVVLDGEGGSVALDVDVLHGILGRALTKADNVVVRIDHQFVDKFVESRIHGDLCGFKYVAIQKPDFLLCGLNRTDIGIGETEDVLAVGLLLVCLC